MSLLKSEWDIINGNFRRCIETLKKRERTKWDKNAKTKHYK